MLRLEQHTEWSEAQHGTLPLGAKETELLAEHVKEGRDFSNEEPPAGYYKPYCYPHPLQEGWEALMRSLAALAVSTGGSMKPSAASKP